LPEIGREVNRGVVAFLQVVDDLIVVFGFFRGLKITAKKDERRTCNNQR
jgi:hypothetical protein